MTTLEIDGLSIPAAVDVDLGELDHPAVLGVALHRYLTMVSDLIASAPRGWRDDWRFRCTEALVRELGQPWTAARLPAYIERGQPRRCYGNTLALVNRRPGLRYVEGFAIPWHVGEAGAPMLHAWAVNANGRVYDPTWPEPERSAYWGIAFDIAEVRRFVDLDDDTFGILGTEHLIGSPLLRTGALFPEGGSQ
jgi:hypothetical protein